MLVRLLQSMSAILSTCLLLMNQGCQPASSANARYFSDTRVVTTPDSPSVKVYLVLDLSQQSDRPAALAHYTEHLVWSNIVTNDTAASHLHSNAWTSNISAGYWLSGPRDEFPDLLRALTAAFSPIEVTAEFARDELSILGREYDRRLRDNLDAQASTAMSRFLYQENLIAASVQGTPEDISKLDYEQAHAFQVATHTPGNAVLLVVGDLSEKQVRKAIEDSGLASLSDDQARSFQPVRFRVAAPEVRHLDFNAADTEPRILWRKVVALEEAVEFDVLAWQSWLLSEVLVSALPGGLAGPLRYDAFITRSFDVDVVPLDEQHLELWFRASPDRGVTLQQLQSAFEKALLESAKGIPVSTWDRILKRSDAYWPDWNDEDETSDWTARYQLRRTVDLRTPLDMTQLKAVKDKVSLAELNDLLRALLQPGREAVAFMEDNKGEMR